MSTEITYQEAKREFGKLHRMFVAVDAIQRALDAAYLEEQAKKERLFILDKEQSAAQAELDAMKTKKESSVEARIAAEKATDEARATAKKILEDAEKKATELLSSASSGARETIQNASADIKGAHDTAAKILATLESDIEKAKGQREIVGKQVAAERAKLDKITTDRDRLLKQLGG